MARKYNPKAYEDNNRRLAKSEAREAARNKAVIGMRIRQAAVLLFVVPLALLILAALIMAAIGYGG